MCYTVAKSGGNSGGGMSVYNVRQKEYYLGLVSDYFWWNAFNTSTDENDARIVTISKNS